MTRAFATVTMKFFSSVLASLALAGPVLAYNKTSDNPSSKLMIHVSKISILERILGVPSSASIKKAETEFTGIV